MQSPTSKASISNSTIYFVVSKITLKTINGMREMPKLKPKTTHAHKKFHQTWAVQSRGLSQRKLPTKAYMYTNTIDSN